MEKIACTCPVCAKPFLIHAYRLRKQKTAHCSLECYNRAKKQRVVATCQVCGLAWTATAFWSLRRKYCSPICASNARQKRQEISCRVCHTPIIVHQSMARAGKRLYCSYACYLVMYRNTPVDFWKRMAQCPHGANCLYCCWPWLGKRSAGYGLLSFGGKQWLAHRLAWSLHHQQGILPGYFICHYCHNRSCCNPAHLHMGTPRDNIEDALRDGRLHRSLYPRQSPDKRESPLSAQETAQVRLPKESLPALQWLMREYHETQPSVLKRLIDTEIKRIEQQRALPDAPRL